MFAAVALAANPSARREATERGSSTDVCVMVGSHTAYSRHSSVEILAGRERAAGAANGVNSSTPAAEMAQTRSADGIAEYVTRFTVAATSAGSIPVEILEEKPA